MQTIYFGFKCKIGFSNVLDVYIIDDQQIYHISTQGNNNFPTITRRSYQTHDL